MIQKQKKYACPFNEGVVCRPTDSHHRRIEQNCEKCDWNPEVAKARLEEFCNRYGIRIPENLQKNEETVKTFEKCTSKIGNP